MICVTRPALTVLRYPSYPDWATLSALIDLQYSPALIDLRYPLCLHASLPTHGTFYTADADAMAAGRAFPPLPADSTRLMISPVALADDGLSTCFPCFRLHIRPKATTHLFSQRLPLITSNPNIKPRIKAHKIKERKPGRIPQSACFAMGNI